jgi:predicted RNA-binding protein
MMCQATVYLNGEVIMRDVLMVEPIPEGVRLIALFEPVQVVPAAIRQIDLIKHRVILKSFRESGEGRERSGETAGGEPV